MKIIMESEQLAENVVKRNLVIILVRELQNAYKLLVVEIDKFLKICSQLI